MPTRRLLAVLALLITATFAVGVVTAVDRSGDDTATSADDGYDIPKELETGDPFPGPDDVAAQPTDSPTPEPSPEPTASAEPAPSPTDEPVAEPSATADDGTVVAVPQMPNTGGDVAVAVGAGALVSGAYALSRRRRPA